MTNGKRKIKVNFAKKRDNKKIVKVIKRSTDNTDSKPKTLSFTLSKSQIKKYEDWCENHNCTFRTNNGLRYVGAAGGADTFMFTGTGLGVIVEVKCSCGEKLNLTEDF